MEWLRGKQNITMVSWKNNHKEFCRGSSRFTGRVLAHQRRQSNVTTISDITTVYTMSIPSSAGHVMKDSDEDNSETDSQMTSDDFSSDEASSTTEQNLAQDLSTNTKKQEDSDEWYSESEANWTIMDVQSKQVTPSQPCSSIEEDTAKTRTIKSPSGGESVPCTPVEESSNGHLILINQKEKITSTKTTERLRISRYVKNSMCYSVLLEIFIIAISSANRLAQSHGMDLRDHDQLNCLVQNHGIHCLLLDSQTTLKQVRISYV